MLVHICRHAEAVPGRPDKLRELTPAGVADAGELAESLVGSGTKVVLTSPLVRARQTAEIIADALGVQAVSDDRLAPGATAATLTEAVAAYDGPVVVVGHQPDCSVIVEALTGETVTFRPAGRFAIELRDPAAAS